MAEPTPEERAAHYVLILSPHDWTETTLANIIRDERNDALEKAALEADRACAIAQSPNTPTSHIRSGIIVAATEIADAIRAMKRP